MAKHLSGKEKEKILELFLKGKTIDELSIVFSCTKLTISRNLKKQISLEKPLLYKKGLLPNKAIIFFQYLVLALILSYTKTKQILFTKISFIF